MLAVLQIGGWLLLAVLTKTTFHFDASFIEWPFLGLEVPAVLLAFLPVVRGLAIFAVR